MVDNKTAFASCGGGELILWEEDFSKKKFEVSRRCTLFETNDRVTGSVRWSDDNRYLACAGSSGNEVSVINGDSLTIKERINWKSLFDESSEGGRATCVCFVGSSDQILVGSSTGCVTLWDLDSAKSIRTFEGYSSPVTCLTGRGRGSLLVAGLDNGCIVLHNLSSPAPLATMTPETEATTGNPERVNQVACSPFDQKLLASCDSGGAVRLWSVESHRLLVSFISHTKGASDVVFSPYNRKLMASTGGDGKICLYDVQQRKQLTQISCTVGLCSLLLMKDGVTMVAGGSDGNVYFYNLKNCKKPEYVLSGHKAHSVSTMALQHYIKGSHSSRKLPNRQGKKTSSSSKVTFLDDDPLSQTAPHLQTPLPVQGSSLPFTSTIPNTETPLPSNELSVSGVFSPLDAPSTSLVPKSTGLPSNVYVQSTNTLVTAAAPVPVSNPVLQPSDPVRALSPFDIPNDSGRRDIPPSSWPTPLLSTSHSTSVGVFSPLENVAPANRSKLIGVSDVAVVATSSSSSSTVPRQTSPQEKRPVSPQGGKRPNSPQGGKRPDSPQGDKRPNSPQGDKRPDSPKRYNRPVSPQKYSRPVSPQRYNRPASAQEQGQKRPGSFQGEKRPGSSQGQKRQTSPQGYNVPGSSHPKRISPTAAQNSKTAETSSKLESTVVLKESPTGSSSAIESSTLLSSKLQSNLPSPDMKSTPLISRPLTTENPIPLANPLATTVPSTSMAPPVDIAMATLVPQLTTPINGGIPAVHMQYLENLVKESQDETYSAVHRDIRNLSVSMLRQFSTLQNQMVVALTAISNKVDKVSNEVEQLRHQIEHLTPKY